MSGTPEGSAHEAHTNHHTLGDRKTHRASYPRVSPVLSLTDIHRHTVGPAVPARTPRMNI